MKRPGLTRKEKEPEEVTSAVFHSSSLIDSIFKGFRLQSYFNGKTGERERWK